MTGQGRRRPRAAKRIPSRSSRVVGVRRIRWTLLIYGLVILLTVGQLVRIQVVKADDYADRGVQQRARTVELPSTRGRIYDREGDVLATSVPSATIYADPRVFRPSRTSDGVEVPAGADATAVAAALAPLLGLEAAAIEDRLSRDAHFVYLERQLDRELGERIQALELPGIGVLTEPHRVYPAEGLAAQVVGFTGIDGEGLHGLEASYDGVLRGEPGTLLVERAPGGLAIASGVRELVPPEVGTDLVLTLDREIQHAAERAAGNAVDEFDAAGASVLVLEVETGDVLAMASAPGYDPNERTEEDLENWRNRAVTDVFEPGSTQKALTVAAAIEEGLVTPSTVLEIPSGLEVAGKRFTDSSPHGAESWSLAEVMERSSNIGTIAVAQELGPERLEAYLRAFGYGTPSGLDFPGEAAGLLMPHEDWWGTSLPTIAIGQGVAVSLAQLAHAYATLGNDGVAVEPRLVRGTVGQDGRLTPAAVAHEERVVSAETAEQVRQMLERAVHGEHGTGRRAQVDGYRVAGKTGTARKPDPETHGYSSEYIATFAGLAPVDDPKIVVAVMVDEPYPYYGGVVAAPVFREVMSAALVARDVPPDDAGQELGAALARAEVERRLRAREASRATSGDPTSSEDRTG